MAKVTLEFDTFDPDQNREMQECVNASNMQITIWGIDQFLRSKTKYAPDDMSEEVYDAYQEVRDKLWEIINEQGIINLFH